MFILRLRLFCLTLVFKQSSSIKFWFCEIACQQSNVQEFSNAQCQPVCIQSQWKYATQNLFAPFLHTWQRLHYIFIFLSDLEWCQFQTKSVKLTEQKRTSLWRQTDTAHEYSGHEIKYKLWIDSYKTPFRHFKRTNMKSQRVYSSSLCGMIPVVLLVLCFFTANATDIVYGLFKPQFHIFSPSRELKITING